MPTVVNAARITTKDGAVWRECAGCGALAPLAPGVNHCPACQAEPVREYAVSVLLDLAAKHAGGPAYAVATWSNDPPARPRAWRPGPAAPTPRTRVPVRPDTPGSGSRPGRAGPAPRSRRTRAI